MNATARLCRIASRLHWRRQDTPEAARLRAALDMHDLGVSLYRQRMHREHPEATGGEIDAMVRAWLRECAPDPTLPPAPGRRDDGNR